MRGLAEKSVTGMSFALLDIIVAAAIVLFGLSGWFTGLITQLYGVAALVAAWFLAQPLGRVICRIAVRHTSMDESSALAFGTLAAGMLVFAAVKIICHLLNAYFAGKDNNSPKAINRLLGAVFGAMKAFAVAWILLGIVAALPQHFGNKQPNLHEMLRASEMRRVVQLWNPAEGTGVVRRLKQ